MRFDNENISDKNPVGLRLPTELKEKIKNAAKQNQQSMNAEIVRRLEESFENDLTISHEKIASAINYLSKVNLWDLKVGESLILEKHYDNLDDEKAG